MGKAVTKKGAIEIQFNWIFIGIVGVIILAFFIGFAMKQKDVAETGTHAAVMNELEETFVRAKIATGTTAPVDFPKGELDFSCDSYSIGGINKQVVGDVFFGPDVVKGNQILVSAISWEAPYKVTNFVYVTSPSVRYVIVGSGADEQELFDAMPDVTKEIINSFGEYVHDGSYKVRFVTFSDCNDVPTLAKAEATCIRIDGSVDGEGDVYYGSDSVSYYKKASLIGAVFAQDGDEYRCAMTKAYKRLDIVSQMYQERTDLLADALDYRTECAVLYGSANIEIGGIITAAQAENADDVDSAAQELRRINTDSTQSLQRYSCPLVY